MEVSDLYIQRIPPSIASVAINIHTLSVIVFFLPNTVQWKIAAVKRHISKLRRGLIAGIIIKELGVFYVTPILHYGTTCSMA